MTDPPAQKYHQQLILENQSDRTTTNIFNILRLIAKDEIGPFQKTKEFVFPFFVTEKSLSDLRDEILCQFKRLCKEIEEVTFTSLTRFEDRSSIQHNSFDSFLSKAGNKEHPQAVCLQWTLFKMLPAGEFVAGEVTLNLMTEKDLVGTDKAIGQINHSWIELKVSGSDQDWVEKAFNDLNPHINETKLGGIFRPLWIFRNPQLINLLTCTFSGFGYVFGSIFMSRMVVNTEKTIRREFLKHLIDEPNIAKKLDLLSQWQITPTDLPWWGLIAVLGGAALSAACAYAIGLNLFPRLTPRSCIAIGLSSLRAQRYLNGFRFLIFSLLIVGIIVPVVIEIAKHFF
jgi:hypothetical protein